MKKHIFIIGSKGIPANYGGFETFVDRLVQNRTDNSIQYHVACMGTENKKYTYQGADCFQLKIPKIGPARAVCYDIQAVRACLLYVRQNRIKNADIYILACRIGPFIAYYQRKMKKLGIKLYVNPDGHEWMRGKWNFAIKRYWKFSERLMVKHADLLICDSKNIEAYIQKEYQGYKPKTTFIAYGADTEVPQSTVTDKKAARWYQKHSIKPSEYYLVVGRFVPENNYQTMIREFMSSTVRKDLVLITNIEHNKFYDSLEENTGFTKDMRIKFVGTVYDNELINRIRKDAFAYLHGHEVGGTNPSLLEALSITNLNLLLDVGFNREVGEDGALYFNKDKGNLRQMLEQVDSMSDKVREEMGLKAKQRINEEYSWGKIVTSYERLFLAGSKYEGIDD